MTLVQRFDRLTTRFDIVTAPTDPEPGRGTAIWTPEGYLLVDAYTCRSGLLPYSDGRETWLEYRPPEELIAALPTFARLPVTDGHPKSMVSSETWVDVARGTGGDTPRIVVDGGTTYIRDSLLITAQELLDKLVRPNGPRCVSIGFLSDVRDEPGMFMGRRYLLLQTGLIGNHDAIVLEGRAGDVCRIYMDSAAWTVGQEETDEMPMPATNKPAPKTGRSDNLGTPTETTTMIAPDGSEQEVPTWIANELQELEQLRAQKQAPAAAPPAPGTPAPAAPAVDVAPPILGAAAPAPGAPIDPEKEKKDAEDEEKEKEKSMDAIRNEFKRRNRTERRALRVGFDDAHIDRVQDTDQLARDIVGKRMPWAAEGAKTARSDALDLLVDTAMGMPEGVAQASTEAIPAVVPENPQPFSQWQLKSRTDAKDTDPVEDAEAEYLASQGY